MWVKRRHKLVNIILRPFFVLYLKTKYKCKFEKPIKTSNGALVISNHVTSMDQFLISLLFKEPLYHMMSKDVLMHRFTGKLIQFLVNPIPKEKSKSTDITAIKNCIRVAKENGIVSIFVEGNRTLSGELCYVDFSIAKLAKLLKKPLYIVNIEGGYHTDPRWANTIRKGKLNVRKRKVISYEEIKEMSEDELYKVIIENLNVDNYSSEVEYKGKNKAEHLERVFYICPVCGSYHTISTCKDTISCSNCGLNVTYGSNFKFITDNEKFKFKHINEWYNYQVDVIKDKCYQDNELIYEDSVGVYIPRVYQKKECLGKANFKMYNDRFEFVFENNTIVLNFNDIEAVTLVGKKKMNIYTKDNTYQLFEGLKLNLLKYMHMYYVIYNRLNPDNNGYLGL